MVDKTTWLEVWKGLGIQAEPGEVLTRLKEGKQELDGKPALKDGQNVFTSNT